MAALLVCITLNIFVAIEAPPIGRCFVQTPLFRGEKTDCGGALKKASELFGQQVSPDASFGAHNMADLILSRGGIFDYEQKNLDEIHVCAFHQNQLGTGWIEVIANRPKKRAGTRMGDKCNIAHIDGFKDHQVIFADRFVTKQEAAAVMSQKSVLVTLGTAMCKNHQTFFKGLVCADDAATNPASDEESTSGSTTKRRRTECHIIESPVGHSTWRGAGQGVCITPQQPQQQTPGRGAGAGESSFEPSSGASSSLAEDSPTLAREQACEGVKTGVRFIATALGIPPETVNFGKWKDFSDLAPDYRRKKVNVARKVTDAVMSAFAPGQPQELFRNIAKKYIMDMWDKENSERFTIFVEGVIDLYREASTRQQRLQTLALIAPVMRYLEIQKFCPSLTMYSYKEARRYSKLFKAGMAEIPEGAIVRERYNKRAVERFIFFITSPNVVSDMPFGHVTVKYSSGVKEELPNLIRTTVNQRIIQQYRSYLKDTGHDTVDMRISDSTMLRILKACKAMTRKSLMGLDYYTFDGIEGISDLIELTEELKAKDGDAEGAKDIISKLKELKTFFKTDYKIKIQLDSPVSDYSRSYALSDPIDRKLQAPGLRSEHEMRRSPQIMAMWQAFQSIQNKIDAIPWNIREKTEKEFVLEQAKMAIYEWQKHIIRTINQNDGKTEILQNLPDDAVWILMDWAMKFLPRKGIEGATEWFGKRGINWHISYALVKHNPTDYAYRTYVHIFDPIGQVSNTTLAIMQDVLERVKSERPEITKAYFRSDNANCYHSTETLAAINAISEKTGVKILRYDFSDPQSGKDACDRATSVIKRHINIFVAENHACTTAAELLSCGNSHHGVKTTTFIHAGLKGITGGRGKGTIDGISKLHNWDFSASKPRAWNAYKIGEGKLPKMTERTDPLPRLDPIYTVATHGEVHNNLLQNKLAWGGMTTKTIPQNEQAKAPDNPDGWVPDESDETEIVESSPGNPSDVDDPDAAEGRNRQRLFPCEEDGCTKVYQTYHNWHKHVSIGRHTKRLERESLADYSIKTYAESIQNNMVRPFPYPSIELAVTSQLAVEEVLPEGILRQKPGWAHKIRKPSKRFTADQKAFLTQKFDEGASTGRKYNPHDAEKLMRQDPRFPNKVDWLTKTQIASYWSHLSQIREKTGAATATTPRRAPPPLTAGQRTQEQAERAGLEEMDEIELEQVATDEYANGYSEHIDETIRAVLAGFVETIDD